MGYSWDVDSFTMTFFTLREVKEGDELTIGYIDEYLPHATRQERLNRMYLFECRCKACSKDPEARAKSDVRRAQIANLEHTLSVPETMERWWDREALGLDADAIEREIIKPLTKGYTLFAKEELYGHLTPMMCADALMKIYLEMQDMKKAVYWARRALAAWMVGRRAHVLL